MNFLRKILRKKEPSKEPNKESTSGWGTPTEDEVSAVLESLLKDPKQLDALELLYGVSRENKTALREAVRKTMIEGGVRRLGGQKWGE